MSNEKKTKLNIKTMEKWEKVRQMGRVKFIIIHGILLFGMPMAMTISIANRLINKHPLQLQLLINIPLFLLVGLFYGFFTWKTRESMYTKYQAQTNRPEPDSGAEE